MLFSSLKNGLGLGILTLVLALSGGCDEKSPADSKGQQTQAPTSFAPSDKGLIIPAYFYPTWWDAESNFWDEVVIAAAQVPIIAIINPASGPGEAHNSDYQRVVDEVSAAGGRLIGYVHTSYTERNMETILAEVDLYYQWYGVDGIFFDEVTNDTDTTDLEYYAACFDHVRGKDPEALVVLNPGTDAPAAYLDHSTQMILFEKDHAQNPLVAWTPHNWVAGAQAQQISVLAHNVPDAAAMGVALDHAAASNGGWFYITDDVLPNPWDRLPSYWAAEVEAIGAYND